MTEKPTNLVSLEFQKVSCLNRQKSWMKTAADRFLGSGPIYKPEEMVSKVMEKLKAS